MAWALCVKCKTIIEWYAGRGWRLSDYECPECGGRLKNISYDEAQWAIESGSEYYILRLDRWVVD